MPIQSGHHKKHTHTKKTKTQDITNAGDDIEEREPSYTISGNVSWYNHCGKQYGGSSKN